MIQTQELDKQEDVGSVEILNNFLPKKDFLPIKKFLFSNAIPWYYNEVLHEKDRKNQKLLHQFTHMFYENNKPVSHQIPIIQPLIDCLNPLSILRIKANLNEQTDEIIETGYHTDYEDSRLKSAVYFLNTCDGYCKVMNKKIYSVENKIVIFNSNVLHTGSTTTNEKRRILINFIYIPNK